MRGDEEYVPSGALRVLPAATAGLAGVIAASAAAGYDAVVRTDVDSGWRDHLGSLGWISILAALAAVALGIGGAVLSERRAAVAVAATGAILGLATIGYWVWVIEGILDTT